MLTPIEEDKVILFVLAFVFTVAMLLFAAVVFWTYQDFRAATRSQRHAKSRDRRVR